MLTLILSVLFYIPIKITENFTSKKIANTKTLFSYGVSRMIIGVLIGLSIMLIKNEFPVYIDLNTVLISLLFGAILSTGMMVTVLALKHANVTITSVFMTASLIIPILIGYVFLNEKVNVWQIVLIIVFLLTVYPLVSNKQAKKPFTIISFIACLLVWLTSGFGTASLQLFFRVVPQGSVNLVLVLSYAFGGVILTIVTLLFKDKKVEENNKIKLTKSIVIAGFICTLFYFLNQQFITILTNEFPSSILFPVSTGGGVVMGSLIGLIVYREKLSVTNYIALVIGIASLILVGIV